MNRFYRKFEIVKSDDGIEYYQPPSWLKSKLDGIESREIVWQEGDRLDIIAQQVYGDSNLWKAIALFNDIGYILSIRPGQVLFLPTKIKDLLDRI